MDLVKKLYTFLPNAIIKKLDIGGFMKIYQRAIIHLLRNFRKSILLFGLVFILGSLAASAISVTRAFYQTESNLRSTLPAIASIRMEDDFQIDYWSDEGQERLANLENVSLEQIRRIGELSYVSELDYSVLDYGFQLYETLMPILYPSHEREFYDDFPLALTIKYVNRPEFSDLSGGLINLVDGRSFSDEDLTATYAPYPAIVSAAFAEENNLNVRDLFTLQRPFFDMWQEGDSIFFGDTIYLTFFEFEIIGLFEATHDILAGSEIQNDLSMEVLLNQIYLTSGAYNSITAAEFQISKELYYDIWQEQWDVTNFEDMWSHAVFLLYDPLDLAAFSSAAGDILPDHWEVYYLSNIYGDIAIAMISMGEIADVILIGAVITTLLVVSLLLVLFLRDRKKEIGIYLALGEKKIHVIMQIMIEVLIVGGVALLLSLGSGIFVANQFSEQMLLDEVIRQQEEVEENRVFFPDDPLHWFSPGVMTTDEMMSHFQLSFEAIAVAWFYAIGFVILSISTVIPVFLFMLQSPKDILISD